MFTGFNYTEFFLGFIILFFIFQATKGFIKHSHKENHKRIRFLDFLKGLAIIAIVAIHAIDFVPGLEFLKGILWFAIPLFIIESGYLLSLHHNKKINFKEYYSHVFFRVFLIYVIFVLVIRWYLNQPFVFVEIMKDILLGRTNGNFYESLGRIPTNLFVG